jgi:hypothetical protein
MELPDPLYEKCTGIKCSRCPGPKSKKRAAIFSFTEDGNKNGACMAHIKSHERDIFKPFRLEQFLENLMKPYEIIYNFIRF